MNVRVLTRRTSKAILVVAGFMLATVCVLGLMSPSDARAAETSSSATVPVQLPRLMVEVWTDHGDNGAYSEGESILIFYRVGGEAFIRLFNINAEGRVKQVFPNQWDRDDYAKRGRLYAIPARSSYVFAAGPPFGTEHIVALATRAPLPEQIADALTRDTVTDSADFQARLKDILESRVKDEWAIGETRLVMAP